VTKFNDFIINIASIFNNTAQNNFCLLLSQKNQQVN